MSDTGKKDSIVDRLGKVLDDCGIKEITFTGWRLEYERALKERDAALLRVKELEAERGVTKTSYIKALLAEVESKEKEISSLKMRLEINLEAYRVARGESEPEKDFKALSKVFTDGYKSLTEERDKLRTELDEAEKRNQLMWDERVDLRTLISFAESLMSRPQRGMRDKFDAEKARLGIE